MLEKLYVAGLPITPFGWVAWSMIVVIAFEGVRTFTGWPESMILLLFAVSVGIRAATALLLTDPWSRFALHLASWLLFWRAFLHEAPWYTTLFVPLLFAIVSLQGEERRRQECEEEA